MWTSTESTKKELECAVCMEPCTELSVTCCNGHMVCENHYLYRTKAIFEEGRSAFTTGQEVQRCFLCRTDLPDKLFSNEFFNRMVPIIVDGHLKNIQKKTGKVFSKEDRNNMFKKVLKKNEELGF